MKTVFYVMLCLPVIAVLVFSGCGDSSGMGQVEGVVTIDGKPAPAGLEITFSPEDGGQPSYGHTDQAGHYVMMQPGDNPGVPVGMCTVYITPEIEDIENDTIMEIPMPREYTDQSTQKFEVKPGKQEHSFDIPTK